LTRELKGTAFRIELHDCAAVRPTQAGAVTDVMGQDFRAATVRFVKTLFSPSDNAAQNRCWQGICNTQAAQ